MTVPRELSILDLLNEQLPASVGCLCHSTATTSEDPMVNEILGFVRTVVPCHGEHAWTVPSHPDASDPDSPPTFFGIALDKETDCGLEHLSDFIQSQVDLKPPSIGQHNSLTHQFPTELTDVTATTYQLPTELTDVTAPTHQFPTELTDVTAPIHQFPTEPTDVTAPIHQLPTAPTDVTASTHQFPTELTDVTAPTHQFPTELTDVTAPTHQFPTELTDVTAPTHQLPTELTDVTATTHQLPTELTDVTATIHQFPTELTDVTAPTHQFPTELTDVTAPTHQFPTELTDVTATTHQLPTEHTDVTATTHQFPTELTDVTALTHQFPSELTDVTAPTHQFPTELTDVTAPIHQFPTELTDVTAPIHQLPTELTDVTARSQTLSSSIQPRTEDDDTIELPIVNSSDDPSLFPSSGSDADLLKTPFHETPRVYILGVSPVPNLLGLELHPSPSNFFMETQEESPSITDPSLECPAKLSPGANEETILVDDQDTSDIKYPEKLSPGASDFKYPEKLSPGASDFKYPEKLLPGTNENPILVDDTTPKKGDGKPASNVTKNLQRRKQKNCTKAQVKNATVSTKCQVKKDISSNIGQVEDDPSSSQGHKRKTGQSVKKVGENGSKGQVKASQTCKKGQVKASQTCKKGQVKASQTCKKSQVKASQTCKKGQVNASQTCKKGQVKASQTCKKGQEVKDSVASLESQAKDGSEFMKESHINAASSSHTHKKSTASSETSQEQETKGYKLPFISTDELENQDNEDPRWRHQALLSTNEERYRLARRLWKNPCVPDPHRNLTCFGSALHSFHSADSLPSGSRKRQREQHLDTEDSQPARKRQRRLENAALSTNHIARSKHRVLNEYQEKRRRRNIGRQAAIRLESTHHEKQYMLDLALEEVIAIHHFYDGLPNQDLTMTREEVAGGFQAMEDVYQVFGRVYGYTGQQFYP